MALLAWLRSRPDDWALSVEHLRGRFKVGINKMHNLVRELVELGWVTRERKRDPVTKAFVGMEYVVLDEAAPPEPEQEEARESSGLPAEPSHENHDVAQASFPLCAEPRHDLPRLANHDDILRTDSNQELSHTPLPPQPRPAEVVGRSILDEVTIRSAEPEPPPARWVDLAAIWPWEDGESRIQAEARFEGLDRANRRHVLVAAPAYLRAMTLGPRSKRCHLKTFIAERLYLDYPADGEVPPPPAKQVFVAVGTPAFAAWDRAYRAAGRPGMPAGSSHNGRNGWWRPSLFPAQDWSYDREVAARRAREGPGAAA
ncbi:hypothetical protein ABE438_17480 [Bosea sp. TWI1241]|uniref:hypothetical protein n=1 Tax=Bosea sp. TWI1241 TaxID=3148904 RepID=UPI003207B443